ncbi:MAG: phosphatase PAP2 family protein [Parvibaculaceae bacterium]|nr:phosphatase PAP2 family protein [Parvibaculaceae bacterium]
MDFLTNMDWVLPLRHEALTVIFNIFTWMGYTPFFLIAIPAIYWGWRKDVGHRLALIVFASAVLNAFLKDYWQNPRPDVLYALDGRVGGSYGMPSGHAQIGVVMWFWLAYEVRQQWEAKWAYWAAGFIAVGIVLSRLYLGVHDIEDVLMGSVLGVLSLVVFYALLSPMGDRWRSLSWPIQVSAVLLALVALVYVWPKAEGAGEAASIAGFLLGWVLGALLEQNYLRFEPARLMLVRLAAVVLGVVSVFWVFGEVRSVADGLGSSDWIYLISGSIVAFYISFGAPLLMVVTRLARRIESR